MSALPHSLLQAVSFRPRSLKFPNAWVGHLPFAAWLTTELAPEVFVELGTHSGNSFFSFCQAVADAGLRTRCYAVDTWKGDEHAEQYGEDVFAEVSRYHDEHYVGFSRLLRARFDEAVHYFDDASVDLLHIDGLHTYEAVRYDFETWLCKLSPGALVLFHDTNVRERKFGVWKFWLELRQAYPNHLEFTHSHGLGVLQLNNAPTERRRQWLVPGSKEQETVLRFFTAMGMWHLDRSDLRELRGEAARLHDVIGELNAAAANRDAQLVELHRGVVHRDTQITQRDARIARISAELAERDREAARLRLAAAELTALRHSRAWRLTAPARLLGLAARRLLRPATPHAAGPDLSAFFDAAWYLELNPDVRAARIDPFEHFRSSGWREGRSPHPLFDTRWYLETYPDVRDAKIDPLEHFITVGWREGRNPHKLFDTQWYLETYPDVRDAQVNPLEHYIANGASELRHPHPAFDAAFYVAAHPEAARNPLLYHVLHGETDATRESAAASAPDPRHAIDIRQYLPRHLGEPLPPIDVAVEIIIPVYRGLEETRRCVESVLADPEAANVTVRVIDDYSPDDELSAWLQSLASDGRIEFSRNEANLGFVQSVNRGMEAAGRHDVVLLNSDTEVPPGFLRRLAWHAYSGSRVGTVTPLSNYAGEMCSYPAETGGPLPPGFTLGALNAACHAANDRQSVEIPTGRGFCLYIRRDCLDEVGLLDAKAFGRGYGEETDFCQRALAAGWRHLLACDTFVYHAGQVSFGKVAPERETSWRTLVTRHPALPDALKLQLALAPTKPAAFAATAALFRSSSRPTVLLVAHEVDMRFRARLEAVIKRDVSANLLLLCRSDDGLELSVPSLPGHPVLRLPEDRFGDVLVYARACGVGRVQVQHWLGLGADLRDFLKQLGTPVEITIHEDALDTFQEAPEYRASAEN